MPQAKKKTATKTAKRPAARPAKSAAAKTSKKSCAKDCHYSNRERNHIYFITAMSIIMAILLCANIAMMTV